MQNFSMTGMQVHDNTLLWKESFDGEYVRIVQSIIDQNLFEGKSFYIHQFIKRVDDTSGVKKMMHHPRLSKPLPTPGATLLRCEPFAPEQIKIVWTLPNQENFGMYSEGKIYANEFVFNCIQKFLRCMKRYKKLQAWAGEKEGRKITDKAIEKCFIEFIHPEPGDVNEEEFKEIMRGKVLKGKSNMTPQNTPQPQIL